MKKYAAPEIIRYIFITPLILCLCLIVPSFMFIGQGQYGLLCFGVLFYYLFTITIELILFHNAFLRIFIDDKGIANKHFRLYWDDAPAFRIIEVNFGVLPKIYSVDILCIGDVSTNSFPALDPRKTIFISLNKRTKEIIRTVAGDNFPL